MNAFRWAYASGNIDEILRISSVTNKELLAKYLQRIPNAFDGPEGMVTRQIADMDGTFEEAAVITAKRKRNRARIVFGVSSLTLAIAGRAYEDDDVTALAIIPLIVYMTVTRDLSAFIDDYTLEEASCTESKWKKIWEILRS